MKVKKNLNIHTDNFWCDVVEGYLKPEDILVDEADILKVKNAIEIVVEFQNSCEDNIEDFYV